MPLRTTRGTVTRTGSPAAGGTSRLRSDAQNAVSRLNMGPMGTTTTLELTPEELVLLRHALRHYLSDFGHEEADIRRLTRALIGKLPAQQQRNASPSHT